MELVARCLLMLECSVSTVWNYDWMGEKTAVKNFQGSDIVMLTIKL
jgi:hypothetical protein